MADPRRELLDQTLSRRQALGLLAAGGAGLLAAACGVSTATAPIQKVNAGDFKITNPGVKLPTGDVTLTWMDSGDQKAIFFNAFSPPTRRSTRTSRSTTRAPIGTRSSRWCCWAWRTARRRTCSSSHRR
ncbi:MAG: hypothetical protein ACREQM_19520 [Candidatus Dormibacteraceae bacterium]